MVIVVADVDKKKAEYCGDDIYKWMVVVTIFAKVGKADFVMKQLKSGCFVLPFDANIKMNGKEN